MMTLIPAPDTPQRAILDWRQEVMDLAAKRGLDGVMLPNEHNEPHYEGRRIVIRWPHFTTGRKHAALVEPA